MSKLGDKKQWWNSISTVPEGVMVFAYRNDQRIVHVCTFSGFDMTYIREKNPNFAYTHWLEIPEDWGKLPKFPELLHKEKINEPK